MTEGRVKVKNRSSVEKQTEKRIRDRTFRVILRDEKKRNQQMRQETSQ